MEEKKKRCCGKKKEVAVDEFPGAAINVADSEKDTEQLQKERTATLDNNPRSDN